jgi:hypothetical protein
MTKNNKITFIVVIVFIFIFILTGCQVSDSDGSGGGGGSKSSGSTTDAAGTGTVTGTINDDAEITLEQSDGTSQTTTTSEENPDYIFEDVPSGEATITIASSDGSTTEQSIQINAGEETQVNPFGSTQEIPDSLTVNVYDVPVYNNTVDNINGDPLGEAFYAKEINIPTRAFEEGFPGVTDKFEWFGVVYEGTIIAPATGTYTFKITSDDGAVLYIDGNEIVDGDGVHAPKSYTGTVELVEGQQYDFLLKYFQGPRYHICLVLEAQLPGGEMEIFNMEDFDID